MQLLVTVLHKFSSFQFSKQPDKSISNWRTGHRYKWSNQKISTVYKPLYHSNWEISCELLRTLLLIIYVLFVADRQSGHHRPHLVCPEFFRLLSDINASCFSRPITKDSRKSPLLPSLHPHTWSPCRSVHCGV